MLAAQTKLKHLSLKRMINNENNERWLSNYSDLNQSVPLCATKSRKLNLAMSLLVTSADNAKKLYAICVRYHDAHDNAVHASFHYSVQFGAPPPWLRLKLKKPSAWPSHAACLLLSSSLSNHTWQAVASLASHCTLNTKTFRALLNSWLHLCLLY